MDQPFIKFIAHTISLAAFIFMIILNSTMSMYKLQESERFSSYVGADLFDNYTSYKRVARDQLGYDLELDDFYIRPKEPDVLDILIALWIAGLIWQECRKAYKYGLRDYLRSFKNILNCIMNMFYVASFVLKYYLMVVVSVRLGKMASARYWQDMLIRSASANVSESVPPREIADHVYWLNSDRAYWTNWDPVYLSEAFFACANVLSWIRILFLVPVSPELGPLEISLENMISVSCLIQLY